MRRCLRLDGFVWALWAVLNFVPATAEATSADTIAKALMQTLSTPSVRAGSTTPKLALITGDNHLEQLLVTTPEVVGGMREAILGAKREILLQIYEWNSDDDATRSVMDALWQRVMLALGSDDIDAELTVRVVVSRTFWAENDNSQIDLHDLIGYLSDHPRAPGRVRAELSSWRASPLSILHSKVLICDAETALVMTGNLNTHGGPYRDSFNMAARITGPVVDILRADWHDARRGSIRNKASVAPFSAQLYQPTAAPAAPRRAAAAVRAAVLTRDADWRPWGGSDQNPQDQGIVALIDSADTRICIINPSIGIQQVQEALLTAIIERGVEVFAVLSKEMNRERDRRFFGGDNTHHVSHLYDTLLRRAGAAAADKLHVAWGAQDGIRISPAHSSGNIHAKVMDIDDNALLIGSSNLNWLSWYNSRELSVALIGENVAFSFRESVFRTLYQRAVRMDTSHLEDAWAEPTSLVYKYLSSRTDKRTP